MNGKWLISLLLAALVCAAGLPVQAGKPIRRPGIQHSRHYRHPPHHWRHHRHRRQCAPYLSWGVPWGSFGFYVGPAVSYWRPYVYYPGYRTFSYHSFNVYLNAAPALPAAPVGGGPAVDRLDAVPAGVELRRDLADGVEAGGDGVAEEIPKPPGEPDELARARAVRLISFGDAHFGRRDYDAAAEQYRAALAFAPRLADAHYRVGHADVARGRYDEAAASFTTALRLDPTVADRFTLESLYPDDGRTLRELLDKLAARALANPHDANLLLLIGLLLHDQGETERATAFLQRAADLLGPEGTHLDRLMSAPPAEAPRKRVAPGVDA